MSAWRYYVSSCTCEGGIAVYSDGKTVRARCAECHGDMEIGRTNRELHDRIVENGDRDGVPDTTAEADETE